MLMGCATRAPSLHCDAGNSKVLSRSVLELGNAISGISRVASQAARSIG
jgi:hypothetical protein